MCACMKNKSYTFIERLNACGNLLKPPPCNLPVTVGCRYVSRRSGAKKSFAACVRQDLRVQAPAYNMNGKGEKKAQPRNMVKAWRKHR